VNTPDKTDEDLLMAYADGELDADQAARVEQLLQRDSAAAARVAQHRSLRSRLQGELSQVLAEPVPERLLDALKQPVTDTPGRVVDLSAARQSKSGAARWRNREWMAMAASLIVGVVVGIYAASFNSSQLVDEKDGALVARGRLKYALTTQLASANSNQKIQMGISFRNHSGEYCRSFAVQDEHALGGLACHAQDNWRVQMLTEARPEKTGDFRQASSGMSPAVLAMIQEQISGEPLDAHAEITARQSGWK